MYAYASTIAQMVDMPRVPANSIIKSIVIKLNTRPRPLLSVAIKILGELNEARHQLELIAFIHAEMSI